MHLKSESYVSLQELNEENSDNLSYHMFLRQENMLLMRESRKQPLWVVSKNWKNDCYCDKQNWKT